MNEKKIAMNRYKLQQQLATKKATRIFYTVIILNIILALPAIFEPGGLIKGVCTLVAAVFLSVSVYIGYKGSTILWVIFAATQMTYYFLTVGLYVSADYPMPWVLYMCARCAFCLYSSWAFLISYDVQDVVKEHHKKLFRAKK